MHRLYELKDKLVEELKEYGAKDVTAGSLAMVDTLAHAVKNLDKIIEKCEEEEDGYSSYMPAHEGGSMRGSYDMSNRYSRDGRGSYARGRYAKRDAMGRYSRDSYGSDVTAELQELMRNAPDDMMRQKIQSIISRMGV